METHIEGCALHQELCVPVGTVPVNLGLAVGPMTARGHPRRQPELQKTAPAWRRQGICVRLVAFFSYFPLDNASACSGGAQESKRRPPHSACWLPYVTRDVLAQKNNSSRSRHQRHHLLGGTHHSTDTVERRHFRHRNSSAAHRQHRRGPCDAHSLGTYQCRAEIAPSDRSTVEQIPSPIQLAAPARRSRSVVPSPGERDRAASGPSIPRRVRLPENSR